MSTANKSNLLKLLSNPTESTQLQMELVTAVDVGDVFVNATYNHKDVPLALSTYKYMSFLSTSTTTVPYPNTADIFP